MNTYMILSILGLHLLAVIVCGVWAYELIRKKIVIISEWFACALLIFITSGSISFLCNL